MNLAYPCNSRVNTLQHQHVIKALLSKKTRKLFCLFNCYNISVEDFYNNVLKCCICCSKKGHLKHPYIKRHVLHSEYIINNLDLHKF